MITAHRFTLFAISTCAAFALSACQQTTDANQTTEAMTPTVTVPDETAETSAYTDDNVSASDMVADGASMTDMFKDYSKSMTRMRDEMMIGMGYNDPDTAFAKTMLAHHRGVVDMATIELKYGTDTSMRKLAQQIIDTQQVEMAVMNKWLASHLDTAKPKLETPFVQQAYTDSTQPMYDEIVLGMADPVADMAFARIMLSSHIGAVDMAMIQLKYGTDEEMLELARAIINKQQLEIQLIENWLATHSTKPNSDTPLNDATMDDSNDDELMQNSTETAEEPTA